MTIFRVSSRFKIKRTMRFKGTGASIFKIRRLIVAQFCLTKYHSVRDVNSNSYTKGNKKRENLTPNSQQQRYLNRWENWFSRGSTLLDRVFPWFSFRSSKPLLDHSKRTSCRRRPRRPADIDFTQTPWNRAARPVKLASNRIPLSIRDKPLANSGDFRFTRPRPILTSAPLYRSIVDRPPTAWRNRESRLRKMNPIRTCSRVCERESRWKDVTSLRSAISNLKTMFSWPKVSRFKFQHFDGISFFYEIQEPFKTLESKVLLEVSDN